MPDEGSGPARPHRSARRPRSETPLELVERISDAYGLVLVLILVTFFGDDDAAPEGWGGRVAAIAVAGLTAIIALTSSDARPRRVRLAIGLVRLAVVAAAVAKPISSDGLLGLAFVIDALLLAVAAVTIMRRVLSSSDVDSRTILGALSVFTLLGLLFGYLFLALGPLEGRRASSPVSRTLRRRTISSSATRR